MQKIEWLKGECFARSSRLFILSTLAFGSDDPKSSSVPTHGFYSQVIGHGQHVQTRSSGPPVVLVMTQNLN